MFKKKIERQLPKGTPTGGDSHSATTPSQRRISEPEQQIQETLRQSQESYRTLTQQSLVGIVIVQDFRIVFANEAFAEIYGYSVDELLLLPPDKVQALVHPEEQALVWGRFRNLLAGKPEPPVYEYRGIRKDGAVLWLEVHVTRTEYRGKPAVQACIIDITKRKRAEEQAQHLNLVLRAIRNINQLIAKGTDRDSLLKGACQILAETRCYYAAWIAVLDESRKLVAAAEAGLGKRFQHIVQRFERGDLICCARETLSKTGVLVIRDTSLECADCPIAMEREVRGAMSTRLEFGGKVYGLMTVLVPTNVTADQEEQTLFQEVAGDIAFALHSVQQEDDRKRAEEVLRHREEHFRTLIEKSSDVIVVLDPQGTVRYLSPNFKAMWGRDSTGEIGKDMLEHVHADDVALATEKLAYLLANPGETASIQVRAQHPDGSWHTLEILGRNLLDNPAVHGIVMHVRDITERRRAESALRESEEFSTSLLENAPNPIVVINPDTSIRYVNPSFEKLTGFSLAEVTGVKAPYPWWPEEERDNYLTNLASILSNASKIPRSELIMRNRKGERFWIELSASLLMAHGEVKYYIANWVNITQTKLAEEALRQSEARYRTILEEMEEGYYEADLRGTFTFVNDTMCRMFGYSRDELIGMNYRTYTPEESVKDIFEAYDRVYRTGEALNRFPVPMIRKDGTRRIVEDSVFPLRNDRGEVVGFRGISRDVTERKWAEDALTQSEERYRQLTENAGEAIFVIQDAEIKFMNPKGPELSGYSIEELVSKPFTKFIHPDDVGMVADRYVSRLKGEPVPQVYDFRINRKDGVIRWGELNAVPISWEGRPAVLCFMNDVTERKQAEEKIRLHGTYLQDLLELHRMSDVAENTILNRTLDAITNVLQSPLAFIGTMSADEAVMTVNAWSKHAMAQCAISEKPVEFPISQAGLWGEMVRQRRPIIVNDYNATAEYKRGYPQGHVQIERYLGIPVFSGGEIVLVAAVANKPSDYDEADVNTLTSLLNETWNIIERRRTSDMLRQSEERYRTILENMEDSYFEVDLGGHLTFANSAACRALGYTREQLIGMSYKKFTTEDAVEFVYQAFNRVYQTGAPNRGFSWEVVRPDGTTGFVEASASPIRGSSGEILGFRGVGRDVTERRKVEEQLMLTDRLASVGQLAAGIAHELNNPLTSVIGFADLLLQRDLPADIKADLETVNREARRAVNIVKGLLAFAREQTTEKTLVDTNAIIQGVLQIRSYEQRVNNIEVDARFAPALPLVMGNGAQLQQVFINIIVNAEQAMLEAHGRGRLTIVTEQVGDMVRASFVDDGPGISPENMRHLFTPFFTTRDVGKGTGLGLSISHGIVTEHGGRIWAESEPGKGTTFVVELPLSK